MGVRVSAFSFREILTCLQHASPYAVRTVLHAGFDTDTRWYHRDFDVLMWNPLGPSRTLAGNASAQLYGCDIGHFLDGIRCNTKRYYILGIVCTLALIVSSLNYNPRRLPEAAAKQPHTTQSTKCS